MPKLQLNLQIATDSGFVPTKKQFKTWVKAALRVDTEVTIRIVDSEEGRMFNSTYRGKDYSTNVLTFPLAEEPHLMGDIVICAPIVEAEAKSQNKSLEAHYAHLTVHGLLHLHGYDHEIDEQAALMESIEVTTLQKLGYSNPYLITEDNHADESHL